MQELLSTTGIILKTEPIDEYDRRIVILTDKHGKISAFARGARRQTNRLMACTDLFCFGDFKLYPGRNSYSLNDANIKNYFNEFKEDFDKAMYGMYFLEIIDFDTRENADELDKLKLLYQALRALIKDEMNRRLIKAAFILKCMMLDGEFTYSKKSNDNNTALYTLDFLYKTNPEKVFSFNVTEEALSNLERIADECIKTIWNGHEFKSGEMLKRVEM